MEQAKAKAFIDPYYSFINELLAYIECEEMVKVFFPDMYLRLVSLNKAASPAVAKIIVKPKMTKTEVKEYLTKIYDINVINVHTANFLGKGLY